MKVKIKIKTLLQVNIPHSIKTCKYNDGMYIVNIKLNSSIPKLQRQSIFHLSPTAPII